MQFFNKNSKNITIKGLFSAVLILLLIGSATIMIIPSVNAHTPPWNVATYAFINVAPNPIGISQTAFLNFWIDKVPPTANSQYGDRWQNFTVTITKPDGTKQTLGPYKSDDVGGAFTTYTPDQIGNYTFKFDFPGQRIAGENPSPITGTTNPQQVGDYYLPSSATTTLTVQQAQITNYPETPLPTDYWTRPISAMNTQWYPIAGNWLGTGLTARMQSFYSASGNFNPYTKAPNTAHILWTKPYAPGGLMGGQYGGSESDSNFYSTAQYEPKFGPPVIMNGILYYEQVPGASTNQIGWVAVDLRTGQTLWTYNNATTTLRMGQILNYITPNQFGGFTYLWSEGPGRTFSMYDAMTGNWILSIVNITYRTPAGAFGPSLNIIESSDGSLLGYFIESTNNTLNMWNSTRAIEQYGLITRTNTNTWLWRPPQGANIPFSYGVQWSVPLVTNMTANNGTTVNINAAYAEASGASSNNMVIQAMATRDVILVSNIPGPSTAFQQPGYIITEAYSTSTGQILWGPMNQTQTPWSRLSLSAIGDGAYAIYAFADQTWRVYSLTTGQQLWQAKQASNAWAYYQISAIIAYNHLYAADFGGHVFAYNLATGAVEWDWFSGSSGFETPYGVWPAWGIEATADGKLYVQTGHEYSPPLFHGGRLYAIDTTTGQTVWSDLSFPISNYANAAIADGILTIANAYDNQIYAYGKGQSATTVSVPENVQTIGNAVLIKGTITDQSPGKTALGIPAAGTPAVSDESMSEWMEYLYQQQPKPTNTTGIPVTLTAIDSNNNIVTIGQTTTNANGNYALMWTPTTTGVYTITATFDGTESYWPSTAQTYIAVATAGSSPLTPTTTPTTTTPSTITPSASPSAVVPPPQGQDYTAIYVAVAAAVIIIIVAATAIILRRR